MLTTEDNPGKYDDLCTYVRETAKATGAIVVVTDGESGHGFSVQGDLAFILGISKMLRVIADEIEADQVTMGLV